MPHVRNKGGNRWEVIVSLGRDPLTGKYRQASRTVEATSKRDATAKAHKVEQELATPTPNGQTVATMYQAWLDARWDHWEENTQRLYAGTLKNHILPELGRQSITKITPQGLTDYYKALVTTGGRSPARVALAHRHIVRAFSQAVRWGWLNSNPATYAVPSAVADTKMGKFTPEEMGKLIAEAYAFKPMFGLYLRVVAATGARRAEVCGVRASDLSAVDVLKLQRQATARLGEVKKLKAHSERSIMLDTVTAEAIREHVTTLPPGDPYIFSADGNGELPLRPPTAGGWFRTVRANVGLDGRIHGMRHAQASELLAAGVDIVAVSERLGHRSKMTTLDLYAESVPASDRRAAEVIGGLLPSAR